MTEERKTDAAPLALTLATRLREIDASRISPNAIRMAKSAIIDTIGVTLGGAAEPAVAILHRTLYDNGVPHGPSLLFGGNQRTGVLDAALLNGTAAHVLDYDDMASAMGGHPSVPVVPVVFALGEALQASGRDVLEAYIVGFEAECRLGRVVHPHHYDKGWHPTSTLGVFGAAAAAARLLRLDEPQTAMALSIAASMASGVKANFGTMTKSLHVGLCAKNGLLAAKLVKNGFTGQPSAFEHKQGFFAAYNGMDKVQIESLLEPWGDTLEVEQEAFGLKQFPCCGSTHPAIRAMLDLVARHSITARDVESIEITAHRRRMPHTDNPDPKSPLGAKFSIQYAAVRTLLDGAPRLDHFEGQAFLEAEVQRLLPRTKVKPYPVDSETGMDMAAEVSVMTHDGRVLTGQVASALGRGPADPMTEQEMWAKFSDCASRVLTSDQAAAAFESLNRFEQIERIADVTKFLEQSPAPRDRTMGCS